MKKINFCLLLFIIVLAALFGFKNPAKAEVGYDLKAESISISPASPEINTTAVITVQVQNIGSEFILNFPLSYSVNFSDYTAEGTASISPSRGATIKTNDY
ncbi:MAG: hypothetical protein Q8O59_04330, partial [bacterium]|nr:hypothetical protein [bacterium]